MPPDLLAVIWKEHRVYMGRFWDKSAQFLVIVLLSGLVFPVLFLSEESLRGYASNVVDMIAFYVCYIYSGMVSEASFNGERANGTMHVVLASPLRPEHYFLGKWLWFMAQVAVLLVLMAILSHDYVWYCCSSPWPNKGDMFFTLFGSFVTLSACSFFIAANSAISLIVRDVKSARLFSVIPFVVPIVVTLALNRFLGLGFDSSGVAVYGAICLVLAVVSFGLAVFSFRFECVRL